MTYNGCFTVFCCCCCYHPQRDDDTVPTDDRHELRHLDNLRQTGNAFIPHRPAPFEEDWGEAYFQRASLYWTQDVRPVDKIHLVAEYYCFAEEWEKWVSARENHGADKVTLCYNMMLMKSKYARQGRSGLARDGSDGLALDGSPLEGLHRTILTVCSYLCTIPSSFGGLLKSPMHLTWDHFIKAGCMHPFAENEEVPDMYETMDKCIWNSNLNPITITSVYMNTPATKVSTGSLLKLCRARSQEVSEAKTGSVKQVVFHSIFTNGLEDLTRMMSDDDLALEPILPDVPLYRTGDYIDTCDTSKGKELAELIKGMTDHEVAEDIVIGSPPVLYTETTRLYLEDPLDNRRLNAMRDQFVVDVKIDSTRSVKTRPPFMYSKGSIFKSERHIMSPEQVNFSIIAPRVIALYHKHEGFGGCKDYRDNAMVKELTQYLIRHWVPLDNDGYRRYKSHAIIGYRYPSHLGHGHHLNGSRAFIGAFELIVQLFSMVFYKKTNARFPYEVLKSTNLLIIDSESNDIGYIRKNFERNIMQMSQAFGRHENVNPNIPVLDVMNQLSEFMY